MPTRDINRAGDRDDPRDCNPFFKNLPATITSRRKRTPEQADHQGAEGGGEESLIRDRKQVFALNPSQRSKWLSKALRQAKEGEIHPSEIYDVISSSRFVADMQHNLGKKIGRALKEQLGLFTGKQQRFLLEQAEITTRFMKKPTVDSDEDEKDDAESKVQDKQKATNASGDAEKQEMMTRIQAFVQKKQGEREHTSEVAEGQNNAVVAAARATSSRSQADGAAAAALIASARAAAMATAALQAQASAATAPSSSRSAKASSAKASRSRSRKKEKVAPSQVFEEQHSSREIRHNEGLDGRRKRGHDADN